MEKRLSYYEIGGIIRRHRKSKKLKLNDIKETSGVSTAMLSKIENGRMIPTIPTLFSIIDALDIGPETFFGELSRQASFPGYIFVRQEDYTPFVKEIHADGFNYFSILEHQTEGTSLQVSLLKLAPSAKRKKVTTLAFEYIYVVAGTITYYLGDYVFEMREGDSLFFNGNIPHVPANNSEAAATLLVVYLFT